MQAILNKKSAKFTSLFTGDSIAFKFYQKSIEFRIKGEWKNAGDNLIKCAEKYIGLRMFQEAACIYYEAGDCYVKVDKSEAQIAYASAVKIFCDLSSYDIAGRIERTVADINASLKHWEDAALHYRKAANFLLSEKDHSDVCLEKAATALVHIGECGQSHLMFETLGISCATTNLRMFHADEKLMYALLCLFGLPIALDEQIGGNAAAAAAAAAASDSAAKTSHVPTLAPASTATKLNNDRLSVNSVQPNHSFKSDVTSNTNDISVNAPTKESKPESDKPNNPQVMLDYQYRVKYEEIRGKLDDYDELTVTWQCSKEKLFISNLLKLRVEQSYDAFIDHIYYWNQVKPMKRIGLILLKVPVDELQAIEKVKEEARKIAEAKAKSEDKKKSKKLVPS